MGGTSSSERGWCCCGRRAAEIGDGSLSDKLLPGADEQLDEKAVKNGTVVDDAWLLQVEETRTATGSGERKTLFDEDEEEDEGREDDDEPRKTAWDLSDGDDEQAVEEAVDEEEDEDGMRFARESLRLSTRSTKDSYASVGGRPSNNSLLFVGDVELNQDDKDEEGGDENDAEEEEAPSDGE